MGPLAYTCLPMHPRGHELVHSRSVNWGDTYRVRMATHTGFRRHIQGSKTALSCSEVNRMVGKMVSLPSSFATASPGVFTLLMADRNMYIRNI